MHSVAGILHSLAPLINRVQERETRSSSILVISFDRLYFGIGYTDQYLCEA